MGLRIEIHKLHNGLWEIREGDLQGNTSIHNISKKEVLNEISDWMNDYKK